MHDLWQIKKKLLQMSGSESKFSFLNVRLILRTGVDLNLVNASHVDPVAADKVKAVLQEMGFRLDKEER